MRHDARHAGPKRRRSRLAILAGVIATVLVGAAVWAAPAYAALLCPTCYGFERVSDGVYVDRAMPAELRAGFMRDLAEGRERVARFFGDVSITPTVLACSTPACTRRLGSDPTKAPKGMARGPLGLQLSPLGLNAVIIAHELSHVEVYRRLGLRPLLKGAVPAWFHEGLAVVVSDDPEWLRPGAADGAPDRCVAEPGEDLPEGWRDWLHRAGSDRILYARAACRVLRWMAANGGRPALLALVDRLGAGEPFNEAYREPSP